MTHLMTQVPRLTTHDTLDATLGDNARHYWLSDRLTQAVFFTGSRPEGKNMQILSSAVCRKAAEIISNNGWTQGSHARDTNGMVCPIRSGDAAVFSIYGAISKALYLMDQDSSDKGMQNTQPLWDALTRQAAKERGQYSGVHPLMDYNDDPKRTTGEVIGFLNDCAYALEQVEKAENGEKA